MDVETRNAARELARDGVAAYDAGDYQRALDMLKRAHALIPAPSISVYEARCLARLGKLVEAVERYEDTAHAKLDRGAPDAYRQAVVDAVREVEEVRERLPRLKIEVEGRGSELQSMEVRLDGKLVPRELVGVPRTVNPGVHRVEVRVPGVGRGLASAEATEREVRSVVVRISALDSESGDVGGAESERASGRGRRRTLGYVAVGLGVAGVAVGVAEALNAQSKKSLLDDQCDGSRCPSFAAADIDAFHTARTISVVGYGVGAVGLVTGTLLLLWPESTREQARLRPFVGVGVAGLGGRF